MDFLPLPGAWPELSVVVVVPSSRIGSDATNTAGGSGTTLITTTFTFESRNFVEKISKCQDGSRHSENQLYSYCAEVKMAVAAVPLIFATLKLVSGL